LVNLIEEAKMSYYDEIVEAAFQDELEKIAREESNYGAGLAGAVATGGAGGAGYHLYKKRSAEAAANAAKRVGGGKAGKILKGLGVAAGLAAAYGGRNVAKKGVKAGISAAQKGAKTVKTKAESNIRRGKASIEKTRRGVNPSSTSYSHNTAVRNVERTRRRLNQSPGFQPLDLSI
jgi:hypothetical protein